MPVLHSGYRHLFEQYPQSTLYLLGRDITAEFRPLVKDLRALPPELIKPALEAWNLNINIEIANNKSLKLLAAKNADIIMPDEDISHELAAKYFPSLSIEFSPIFLRWDRRHSESTVAVQPNRSITSEQADLELMTQAGNEAAHSSDIWRRVGALIVKDGKILLRSHNAGQPTDGTSWAEGDPRGNFGQGAAIEMSLFLHAEAALIARSAKEGIALDGSYLYVTTFPCPNCAKLIANAGITKCYYATGYAMLDGQTLLEANDVEIIQVEGAIEVSEVGGVGVPYPD